MIWVNGISVAIRMLKLKNPPVRPAARDRADLPSFNKSRIRLDVWSDYVCPFCYLEEPLLTRLAEQYAGQLVLEWRAFELRPEPAPLLDPDGEYLHAIWNRAVYPMAHLRSMRLRLPPIQPRSRRAFQAAEFACEHGRFAEMHDGIFRAFFQEGRDISSVAVLLQVAESIGLDLEDFQEALESERYQAKVLEDEKLAHEVGITGVPTMVMSRVGEPSDIQSVLSGAQPYELLHATVERLLEW